MPCRAGKLTSLISLEANEIRFRLNKQKAENSMKNQPEKRSVRVKHKEPQCWKN